MEYSPYILSSIAVTICIGIWVTLAITNFVYFCGAVVLLALYVA
jgi:hypothetical protein